MSGAVICSLMAPNYRIKHVCEGTEGRVDRDLALSVEKCPSIETLFVERNHSPAVTVVIPWYYTAEQ